MLVADDQPDIIAALRLALKAAGFEAASAASIEEITRQVDASEFDLLLMDLNYARDTTSGAEGLALIGEVHGRHPHLPIVAMTGWANVDTAVEAMRRGARGYLPKPWDNDALIEIVRREVDEGRAARRAEAHATREWTEARAIQQALLPSALPALAGVDLAARWEPASGFGGDYYDVMPIGDDAVAVCIADVCGKGLPAALLMSNVQATTRAFMTPGVAPEHAVAAINRALCHHAALGRFVTLFVSIYDLRTRHAALLQRRPQPADRGPRRRARRPAERRRARRRRVRHRALRGRRDRARARRPRLPVHRRPARGLLAVGRRVRRCAGSSRW